MSFRITGLSPEPFQHLFGLSETALKEHGVRRYVADQKPGFPDRIEIRDAEPGESVLLLNHVCQPADTPYRATHAIFIREGAKERFDAIDAIPEALRVRLLSLRAFDDDGMMLNADVATGDEIETVIDRLFADPNVAYLHAHNAKQGCYHARIDRGDDPDAV